MKIKWALNELRRQDNEPHRLTGTVDLESSLIERSEDILGASPIEIDGWIIVEGENMFIVDAMVSAGLTVPSTRSLKPVDIKCEAKLQETYLAPGFIPESKESLADDIVIELESHELDLQKSIEDSIILAIPSKVLSNEEASDNKLPKGNDWEVMTEESHKTSNQNRSEEDSPFAALKDLFPEDEK